MEAETYLVERYLPDASADDLRRSTSLLTAVAAEMTAEGSRVRYLGSAFVPVEESCFCQFEGSREAVRELNERAQLPFARIVAAVFVAPEVREEDG
jgi:Protein of unknown function (DUF4242)